MQWESGRWGNARTEDWDWTLMSSQVRHDLLPLLSTSRMTRGATLLMKASMLRRLYYNIYDTHRRTIILNSNPQTIGELWNVGHCQEFGSQISQEEAGVVNMQCQGTLESQWSALHIGSHNTLWIRRGRELKKFSNIERTLPVEELVFSAKNSLSVMCHALSDPGHIYFL